jgi:hypothetical protein
VFFVIKKPRSEHASDEAMHSWLCDVPSVNISKGAPSAGGPARTWNSQANDLLFGKISLDDEYGLIIGKTENDSEVFKNIANS